MRVPTYISPSGLKKFLDDHDQYYLDYLSDFKPDRGPQTQAMSIGSGFDARVKSYMYESLHGKGTNPIYDVRTLFEAQVEKCWWDWCWEHSEYVFQAYRHAGALADLMMELGTAASTPLFEVEMLGTIETRLKTDVSLEHNGRRISVPLFGKPDVFFINKEGAHVILDWKVNGYCSKSGVSPMPGYKKCSDGWTGSQGLFSRANGDPHKDYEEITFKGLKINGKGYLEDTNRDWAIQTATYGWLHGDRVGVENITAIDQLCCNSTKSITVSGRRYPSVRVAAHRTRVSSAFQHATMNSYADLWHRITSGHYFSELSREDSNAKCQALDQMSKTLYCNPSAGAQLFNELTKKNWGF